MLLAAIFTMLILPFSMVGQTEQKKMEEILKPNSSFTATVSSVLQGDLISIDIAGKLISLRLAGVDSPELQQPLGRQARQFTKDLVKNQTIGVKVQYVDRYQRIIGEISLLDGRIVNHELIRWGFAWHYRVSPEPNLLLEKLEYEAWSKRIGLWVLDSPVPPWKFRAETSPPEPPSSLNMVDYDRIFEYGLFGDKKTKLYSWPKCSKYFIPPKKRRLIFSSKLEAKNLGYRISAHCPD